MRAGNVVVYGIKCTWPNTNTKGSSKAEAQAEAHMGQAVPSPGSRHAGRTGVLSARRGEDKRKPCSVEVGREGGAAEMQQPGRRVVLGRDTGRYGVGQAGSGGAWFGSVQSHPSHPLHPQQC